MSFLDDEHELAEYRVEHFTSVAASTGIPNTMLEQDGKTLLRLWKWSGIDEDKLKNG